MLGGWCLVVAARGGARWAAGVGLAGAAGGAGLSSSARRRGVGLAGAGSGGVRAGVGVSLVALALVGLGLRWRLLIDAYGSFCSPFVLVGFGVWLCWLVLGVCVAVAFLFIYFFVCRGGCFRCLVISLLGWAI
jgi:hypothetical protein